MKHSWYSPTKRKSRPFTMLSLFTKSMSVICHTKQSASTHRSLVTRLLIFPVRFAPLAFSLAFLSAASFAFFASLPFFPSSFGAADAGWVLLTAVELDGADDAARECAVAVSSSLSAPVPGVVARDPASDEDSELDAPFAVSDFSSDTSALSRIRSAWSKTIEVRIDSMRTREPVERKM
jgi:hypothetical protein